MVLRKRFNMLLIIALTAVTVAWVIASYWAHGPVMLESALIIIVAWIGVTISAVYYIIKHVARKAVKEALEEKVPPLQVTTRICPQCERGVTEEAKFCPNCGKELKKTK